MKLRLLLIILLGSVISCFGQNQNVIAKFIISDARLNGNDVTPTVLATGGYFVFYTIDGETNVYFGNVRKTSNSQSYGITYNMVHTSTEQSATEYATDTFTFNWSYINTYDDRKGTASIKLVKIQKPAGIAFHLTMIPENLDVMDYKGFMEGSLQSIK